MLAQLSLGSHDIEAEVKEVFNLVLRSYVVARYQVYTCAVKLLWLAVDVLQPSCLFVTLLIGVTRYGRWLLLPVQTVVIDGCEYSL